MAKIGFLFPLDGSQQWDGFNEPGIEHFAGSPFRSLGREGTQNSLDAAKAAPARIRVRRIDVPTASVPGIDGLRHAIQKCQAGAAEEGEKAKIFFDNATAILSKPKISVLQLSDSNTAGVKGPCENGTPYFALMKATGQSKKETGTATGSFGIGKFAPYTVSGLRTVFLTSVWEDDSENLHHYVQGKSILMSYRDGAQTHRGTGFWGIEKNCLPLVGDAEKLPDWLRRDMSGSDATGTTLSILAFTPTKDWEKILAASIAESFFGAIWRGSLEVEIEGGPTLTQATLAGLFGDASVADAIKDQKDEPEIFSNSGHFLNCLSSTESKVEDTENAGLGHCRLHVLVGENLPKKVAFLRNGMLITAELAGLRRFGEFKEFSAVLECLSPKGNAMLRSMEPPAHNDFEPARLAAGPPQKAGRVALKEVAEWVRSMLRRHAQDPVEEVTEIDELAEFFGDDEGDGGASGRDGDENPRGAIKIRARPLSKKKTSTTSDAAGQPGDGDDGDGSTGDGGEGAGENDGDVDGGSGGGSNESTGGDTSSGGGSGGKATSTVTLALRNVRAVVLAPNSRRISFTPDLDGVVRVELEDSGADTNRFLRAVASSSGAVVDGRLKIECVAGKRVSVDIELERAFEGTVRVKANAV